MPCRPSGRVSVTRGHVAHRAIYRNIIRFFVSILSVGFRTDGLHTPSPKSFNWLLLFRQRTMGRIGAIFFIFLYLVAMIRPVGPLFTYVINQDYILEFLCINRDKPELECNGKCYLMQMIEEKNDDKGKNPPRIVMEDYPIGFVELQSLANVIVPEEYRAMGYLYDNKYSYRYSYLDFHPPAPIS